MINQSTTSSRLGYLDSVRGIAALMVFVGHYMNWEFAESHTMKVASIFFNGNDAVSFFFVLSGLVLAYPYVQLDKGLDIGKFYVARVFRIFPAYWVALLINTAYSTRYEIRSRQGLLDIFILNKKEFWNEALLIRGFNHFYIPGWTLTIEMCSSFLMPFLILIPMRNRKLLPWLLLASFLCINITGIFLVHFVLGVYIAYYFKEIQADGFKQTKAYKYRVPLLLIAALFFVLRQIDRASPLGSTLIYTMDSLKVDFFILSGLAAFIFLVFLIHSKKAQRFFEHPVLIFYGKISYGVYLMHWVFVWAMGDNWALKLVPLFPNKYVAFFTVLFVCFVLTTISATLLHYIVELPFIKLAKRLTAKMKPTVSI